MKRIVFASLCSVAFFTACGTKSEVTGGGITGNEPGGTEPSMPSMPTQPTTMTPTATETFHDKCFANFPASPAGQVSPHYDGMGAVFASHCQGTNHQNIQNVQKVVFLGDSVTAGTPPTEPSKYYRNQLTDSLKAKFGSNLEVANCSAWGARTDDLLMAPKEQIKVCFPKPEPKTTLVIMTIGGNDANHWAKVSADGGTAADVQKGFDSTLSLLRSSVSWFKEDPARFPNGVFVVFSNVYEFTDGSGDTSSCPGAALAGVKTPALDYPAQFVCLNEQYLKIAVDTQTDMLFLLEQFCGHGFRREDPNGLCYRGPNTEAYFDLTCIHPTPEGHTRLADMFMQVVNE